MYPRSLRSRASLGPHYVQRLRERERKKEKERGLPQRRRTGRIIERNHFIVPFLPAHCGSHVAQRGLVFLELSGNMCWVSYTMPLVRRSYFHSHFISFHRPASRRCNVHSVIPATRRCETWPSQEPLSCVLRRPWPAVSPNVTHYEDQDLLPRAWSHFSSRRMQPPCAAWSLRVVIISWMSPRRSMPLTIRRAAALAGTAATMVVTI